MSVLQKNLQQCSRDKGKLFLTAAVYSTRRLPNNSRSTARPPCHYHIVHFQVAGRASEILCG